MCLLAVCAVFVRKPLGFLPIGGQVRDLSLADAVSRGVRAGYSEDEASTHPPLRLAVSLFFISWRDSMIPVKNAFSGILLAAALAAKITTPLVNRPVVRKFLEEEYSRAEVGSYTVWERKK